MSHTPHELAEEFPAQAAKIQALKASDAHFAKLADEYHTVNRAVHRAETRVDLITEDEEEALRRHRAHLKDHIWHHLKEASV
jgi:uncharacterized protein